jgi:hypothetical protein
MEVQVASVVERGLRSFDSLAPPERDVFVIRDAELYHEMEGSIGEYILGGNYRAQVAWLQDTLSRIGDEDSGRTISQLQKLSADQLAEAQALSDRYFELQEQRWALLLEYLRRHGVELLT